MKRRSQPKDLRPVDYYILTYWIVNNIPLERSIRFIANQRAANRLSRQGFLERDIHSKSIYRLTDKGKALVSLLPLEENMKGSIK